MNQLLEYLVPVIIFVIWIAGQFLERRKQSGDQDNEPPPGDEHARRREIQEEIQRKIAERRRQGGGEAPPPLAPPVQPTLRQQSAPPRERSFPPPITSSTEPGFFEVPQPGRNIMAELEEQQRRVEESKARAERAFAQSRQRGIASQSAKPPRVRPVTTSLQGEVFSVLRDPAAARKAVVYYEILGTPVGLRRDGGMQPSWKG